MKLLPILAIPAGFICVFYGFRGKSVLRSDDRASGLERAATIGGGIILIACGLGFALLVFRLLLK